MEPSAKLMRRAIEIARHGRGRVEPNPMVGAVAAVGERVIAEGWHERFGGPHAEANALAKAGAASRGADLYVTLEPCGKQGKTPPCADAIIAAGVGRVILGVEDPTQGEGIARLRQAGIEVVEGFLRDECARLAAPFIKLKTRGRPWVIAKWAMTADGRIASRAGDSRWISGEASRRAVHELRGLCDAIVVGSGTALADDPLLTCRLPGRRQPTRVVLDRRARLAPDSQLVQTLSQAPVLVICKAPPPERAEGLRRAGCDVVDLEGRPETSDFDAAMAALGEREMTYALVEGGSAILTAAFESQSVDEARVFVAPKLVGGAKAFSPIGGRGAERMADAIRLAEPKWRVIGDDAMLEALVQYSQRVGT